MNAVAEVYSVAVNSNRNIPAEIEYSTSAQHSLLVGIFTQELHKWVKGYQSDRVFHPIISELSGISNTNKLHVNSKYFLSDNGLLYFEDWNGNNKLCVPESLRVQIMKEIHDSITESAHGG
ncbi:hypothetical protein K435DRAFT_658919, partial [Dendrothele bispora CBS 962.96]